MKHLFLFLLPLAALAHGAEPAIEWSYQLSPERPAVGETTELVITAKLPAHHLLYSSDFAADIGPLPTEIAFDAIDGAELVGPLRAIGARKKKDRTWDVEFTYFETTAEFRQTLRVKRAGFSAVGKIKGQLCNEQDGTCTLFELPLRLPES